jgi:lysozyme
MSDPPISRETAEAWLLAELKGNYMLAVLKASPGLIAHLKVLGAMTDFAYNLGGPRYRASTLRRKINEQDWEGAKQELAKWIYGGGKILPGLVRRRAAESRFL